MSDEQEPKKRRFVVPPELLAEADRAFAERDPRLDDVVAGRVPATPNDKFIGAIGADADGNITTYDPEGGDDE